MRHRQVGEGEPQHRKQQYRRKFDPLGKGADDQCRRNCGKCQLKGHVNILGYVNPFTESGGQRIRGYAFKKQLAQTAKESIAFGKRDAVTVNRPQNGH